ncbi:MAG: hypothetical protein MUD01_21675 [Chloroflexaceae bacterium]|jgi:hypothetical protein|nr:hypothetical protein [Chloroflexaceae bacterium]
MIADDAALVLVRPDDDLNTIITNVREAGTPMVQLLVSDGAAALYAQRDLETLRRSVGSRGIELLLITSDKLVLSAARRADIQTMEVMDARIRPERATGNGEASPYATRPLARDTQSGPANPAQPPAPADAAPNDDDFLRSLEQANLPMPSPAISPAAPAHAYSDFDDFDEAVQSAPTRVSLPTEAERRPAPRRYADDDEPERYPPPRPRVDRDVAGRGPDRPVARPQLREEPERRRGLGLIPLLIGGVLLVLLALIGGVLLLGNRTTVTVNLPVRETQERRVDGLPIALIGLNDQASQSAVQADIIRAEVVYTATGQVTEETLTPTTAAAGAVNVLSLNTQAIDLPQGTEFIAANGQGQECRFATNEAATIPGSSQSRQGAQIITSLGQASVAVTARALGSACNIGENAITQMQIPGQEPINVRAGGNLEVTHGPIGGGSEQPIRVVKDSNVQEVLGQALAGLDNQARQELENAARAQANLTLENTTITPGRNDLSAGQGYEVIVSPAVGQNVDPNNPTFSVTVRGQFSALATPQGRPLQNQLQPAVSEALIQSGQVKPGDGLAPAINNWRWDGTRLTVDSLLQPVATDNTLAPATLAAIRESIRDKPRAEAEAALQVLVERNSISGYTIPEGVQALPGYDFQLDIQVVPPR